MENLIFKNYNIIIPTAFILSIAYVGKFGKNNIYKKYHITTWKVGINMLYYTHNKQLNDKLGVSENEYARKIGKKSN